MLIRLAIVILIIAVVLVFDAPNYKKSNKRGRAVYGISITAAIYLGLDYAAGKDWPDLHNVADFIFSAPAKMITTYFESKS
ncbi:hypothetical protein M3194_17175 [Paenibacillus glycanilyticus]|uniref:hypothetical protein n=1 Tax=Paenibacillus glycanilyticus TaxID=126569 RepID=UPI00203DC357|nr:hypothetical protein [Paenibacillus glycanilyticus]MCM3629081.1 hypothetical protein [Paenibacillus glycanilyticus]